MAVISFDRLINFKQWFDRTNQLGASVGDTTAINTDLGSNLVNAINVVHNKDKVEETNGKRLSK